MTRARILEPTPENLRLCADRLRVGDLVGMPTETVYGLAGRCASEGAVARTYTVKDRPTFDPLIVHVPEPVRRPDLTYLELLGIVNGAELTQTARRAVDVLAGRFWPGPLTLVLPRGEMVSDLVTAGLRTVAVRMPRHEVAQALLHEVTEPLTAPSANRFGRVSPTSAMDVVEELGDRIDLIIDGGPCHLGLESTILALTPEGGFVILRPGGVPAAEIESALNARVAVAGKSGSVRVTAPGMFPHHYAPRKPLHLLAGRAIDGTMPDLVGPLPQRLGLLVWAGDAAAAGHRLADATGREVHVEILTPSGDVEEAARNLFAALRSLDASAAEILFAEPCPVQEGLGHAISDRLQRASVPEIRTVISLEQIRAAEIGRGAIIETPFGRRLLLYADLTASGRFLGFIESWMARLRPYYANSHTVISTTGTLMTRLREEARDVIRRAVGAGESDVVMFCGSGATACVNKLVGLLGLARPAEEWTGFRPSDLPAAKRPVVLVGPYEHHSNELPWAESIAEVVEVNETKTGAIDLGDLQEKLAHLAGRPLIVGSFSAASNVTGLLTDVRGVARALHRAGALVCFDYAAAAPYAPIDMHPAGDEGAAIDAVFVSTHKFVGGPQSSGVLAASKRCFRRAVPERPGGGTVEYVSYFGRHNIDYVRRLDEREEGGTPAIIGDIRAGAAFLVREMMRPAELLAHETEIARRAIARLGTHPRLRLLGPADLDRLAILSFTIEGLHHDFVSTLLDHLFGIQNRAGCACAGPYGHRLLGVGPERSLAFRKWVLRGVLGIKPGWTRITLPVYGNDADLDFILRAIEFVAGHGEAFLPAYELGWRDGVWTARGFTPPPPPFAMTLESMTHPGGVVIDDVSDAFLAEERARYLREATDAAERLRREHAAALAAPPRSTGDRELDALVWFKWIYAGEVPAAEGSWPPPRLSD